MSAPSADRLRDLRAEAASLLAARLAAADAPLAELKDLQDRLKLFDAALSDQHAQNERRLGKALWPVLLVGAVLLIAATVPVRSVPLSLELQASAITLGLPDKSVLESQPIDGELRIEGFSSLESADVVLTAAALRDHPDRIAIRAAETRLRSLSLPAGAQLTVQDRADTTALQVESPRSPVVADVEVRGNTALRLGDGAPAPERAFPHGEWLRLIAGDAAHVEQVPPPMTLSLPRKGDAAFKFDNLRPSTLRFAERREGAGAVAVVRSSLDGGTITLPATDKTVPIAAGDWLEIDGLTLERCEISAGAPVRIKLSGSARTLRMRVGEFDRSLKPSLLEYVSHNHLVTLLWGSAAVLWGALAWMRKQFSGAPS